MTQTDKIMLSRAKVLLRDVDQALQEYQIAKGLLGGVISMRLLYDIEKRYLVSHKQRELSKIRLYFINKGMFDVDIPIIKFRK